MKAEFDQIMWVGNVRTLTFPDQLRAAGLTGCTQISMTPLQCAELRTDGMSLTEIRQRAADNGITAIHLDPLTRWSRSWRPQNMADADAFLGFTTEEFLDIAIGLNATSLSAIHTGPAASVSVNQLTEEFATLCQQAAREGIRCDLEFIPLDWGVPNLKTAATILNGCGNSAAGLVFDFWHFMRGEPDWQLLESFPGERISYVQFADATSTVPAGRSAVDDCLNHRLPLGLGEFDISRLLRTLIDIGGLRRGGPEIFSIVLDIMRADDIAAICRGSLIDALNQAGVEHGLGKGEERWKDLFTASQHGGTQVKPQPAQRSHL